MKRVSTYAFAALLLGIIAMLIVPLPPPLLDLLLGVDVFGSALVLLLSVTVEDPLEFSAFAPMLLLATLFRLALDVSATRLILTQGSDPSGVGALIPAFGAFVVRGNLVVGFIIFIILVTIQFVVIASGSQRVAEVAARFTLDAMPGKQMAIDADVHAGALDSEGARRKRESVQREADFYGAMDGAGKFVKGDAVAALVIVALNLVGGIVVGVAYHGLSPLDSLNTYALLSIGNALLTTLPAFLISTAMGMMVTRVAADGSLGADLATQLFSRPEILRAAGALLLVLALVPALPHGMFILLGGGAFVGAFFSQRRLESRQLLVAHAAALAKRGAMRRPEIALTLVGIDAVSIEIGANLVALLAPPHADALLDRVGEVRRALATDIGIVLPGVRLRDDLARDPQSYAIRIRDQLAGEGRLDLERLLAVGDLAVLERCGYLVEREPVYALPGAWILPSERERAIACGCLVFDPISVIGSHLAEAARAHAPQLLGRQEFATLLEHLRASVPSLIKEIDGESLTLASVQRAFTLLLRERVWPRDPVGLLEAMLESGAREPVELAQAARRVGVPALLRRRERQSLEPLIFDPGFERQLAAEWDAGRMPAPQVAYDLRERIAAFVAGRPPERAAILCNSALRAPLSEFLLRSGIRAEVFAYGEIPPEIEVRPAEVLAPQPANIT